METAASASPAWWWIIHTGWKKQKAYAADALSNWRRDAFPLDRPDGHAGIARESHPSSGWSIGQQLLYKVACWPATVLQTRKTMRRLSERLTQGWDNPLSRSVPSGGQPALQWPTPNQTRRPLAWEASNTDVTGNMAIALSLAYSMAVGDASGNSSPPRVGTQRHDPLDEHFP